MMRRAFAVALPCAGLSLMGCGGGGGGATTAAPGTGAPGTTGAPPAHAPKTVQAAWDHHFGAFADGAVDQIMLDYDDDSRIAVFNAACDGAAVNGEFVAGAAMKGFTVHDNLADIRAFFEDLFKTLGDPPVAAVYEVGPSEQAPSVQEGAGTAGDVMLTWRANSSVASENINYATGSFSFKQVGGAYRINKQNIWMMNTGPVSGGGPPCDAGPNSYAEPASPDDIDKAWKAHISAVVAKDATAVMGAYVDGTSVLQVFDSPEKTYAKATTNAEIQDFFGDVFADANFAPKIKALTVEKAPYNNVFIAWDSESSGLSFVTETITFTDAGKIAKHNFYYGVNEARGVGAQANSVQLV